MVTFQIHFVWKYDQQCLREKQCVWLQERGSPPEISSTARLWQNPQLQNAGRSRGASIFRGALVSVGRGRTR